MQDSELKRRENEAAAALAVFAIGLGLSSAFHSTIQTRQRWGVNVDATVEHFKIAWAALAAACFGLMWWHGFLGINSAPGTGDTKSTLAWTCAVTAVISIVAFDVVFVFGWRFVCWLWEIYYRHTHTIQIPRRYLTVAEAQQQVTSLQMQLHSALPGLALMGGLTVLDDTIEQGLADGFVAWQVYQNIWMPLKQWQWNLHMLQSGQAVWVPATPAYRNDHLGRWVALMSLVFVAAATFTPYASMNTWLGLSK